MLKHRKKYSNFTKKLKFGRYDLLKIYIVKNSCHGLLRSNNFLCKRFWEEQRLIFDVLQKFTEKKLDILWASNEVSVGLEMATRFGNRSKNGSILKKMECQLVPFWKIIPMAFLPFQLARNLIYSEEKEAGNSAVSSSGLLPNGIEW